MFTPPQTLVDAVKNQTLVPFVGAGVSVGAVVRLAPEYRFPDWDALIKRFAQRLRDDTQNNEAAAVEAQLQADPMKAAQLAVDALERDRFLDVMQGAFRRPRKPPGADLSAVQAIWRLQAPFIITTNYDSVLEWPWDPLNMERIHNDEFTPLKMLDAKSEGLKVWYLHGSIYRIDTVILTTKQYQKLYPAGSETNLQYQRAFEQFKQLLATRSFLFVGFSLKEPILRQKLQEVLAQAARTAPIKFLLLKKGETDAASKAAFLENYHVQVIEFENFGAPMVEAIDAIGRAAWPDGLSVRGAGLTAVMEPLVEDLLNHVAGLVLPPDAIARMYNEAKPELWEPAPRAGDGVSMLREAVLLLGDAVAPAQDAVPPLFDFIERVKAEVTEPWLGRLAQWLDDAIQRVAADGIAATEMRQRLSVARDAVKQERVQLLVRIQSRNSSTPAQWLVHAWLWKGTRSPESLFGPEGKSFKEGGTDDVVYDLIDQLEARRVNPDLTSITFIVPSSLACEPIHTWRLAGGQREPPIGVTYTVTVRPLERLERAPLFRRRFKTAWDELKKRAAEMLDLAKGDAQIVILSEAPCASSMAPLSAVLDTPVPAIVWSADSSTDPRGAEKALRTVLESGPISQIPDRIRQARRDAFGDTTGAHRGMQLTLIWDDADYAPPDQDPASRVRLDTV
jgi:hypothetical protein